MVMRVSSLRRMKGREVNVKGSERGKLLRMVFAKLYVSRVNSLVLIFNPLILDVLCALCLWRPCMLMSVTVTHG